MAIPPPLDVDFEPAQSQRVRARSFGALTEPRRESSTFNDNVQGTLHDQRIFGPLRDLECFCGRYVGERYKGMICDRCGVKVTLKSCRSGRFGHIEFRSPIAHPLSHDHLLQCFPVMPGQFLQSPRGALLADAYDELILAADRHSAKEIASVLDNIIVELVPVAILMDQWKLERENLFAYGLALVRKELDPDAPQFCPACGYLLAGLRASDCPGCGNSLD